jgi:two-component system cell cycle response regulator
VSAIRVLLIEDNPGDARLIREALKESTEVEFDVQWAERLSDGLALLSEGGQDAVVTDLALPDSQGYDTFLRVRGAAIDVPIVVMSSYDDQSLALRAVKEGAEDYLVKGRADLGMLGRSVLYAIERHQHRRELRMLTLVDELTGLHNRRGFLTLADHRVKLANRTHEPLSLLLVDVDDMRSINQRFGHGFGDRALRDIARMLGETFRESDIVARVGGDEFCVLLSGPSVASGHAAVERLNAALSAHNDGSGRPYVLAVTIGFGEHDPEVDCTLESLMNRADHDLGEQRQDSSGVSSASASA